MTCRIAWHANLIKNNACCEIWNLKLAAENSN